jgi:hypothetical protein
MCSFLRFCHAVQNGQISIMADDFQSFLYPEDQYDPEVIDEGLLRGPFLLSVRFVSGTI